MNEHQPQPPEKEPRHRQPEPTLEALTVKSEDPLVLARWKEGLAKWGYAFVAFADLHLPELNTPDALTAFEDLYSGSYESLDAVAEGQIEALGWIDALARFRQEEGITDDLLDWNYAAVLKQLSIVYSIVESGGEVHVFAC
jgi:hypothetical protein